ncbi:ATP-dependent DNA helicase [Paenibacillus puldeungensis]|uniref:ATP-dependent DNA helicase n=1 Tax=Paenibacillus puldeungensis TaxID=696536 RepID=A0ABW3S077_9BACL
MNDKVCIAVRPLVEYVYRSGDLESGGFRTAAALIEGTRTHQQVQKEYGELDQKEVYVSAEIPCGDLLFVVDGRCDGLLMAEDGSLTVDEIKSTSGDLALITAETYPVHWAQAKFYAYMYALAHDISEMTVQLTYVQTETGERKQYQKKNAFAELASFVLETVQQYAPYARLQRDHRLTRDLSIKGLAFPFPAYRAGQRKLAGAVYKTIEEGVGLFAKAPTGIGKTISTTFPAIKSMGEGWLQHFFYLTAKTITRTAAEEAFVLMQSQGLHIHAVTLTAKEKICFREEGISCNKEDCIYADGYHDRINGAILDILAHETLMTRTVVEEYARKHRVCPFEFSIDLAYAADVVICDYNYAFDPRVSLKRMFGEQKRETALLIDEAHNLVDRAREMFSSQLQKSDFLALQRAYKGFNAAVYQAAKAVNAYFIQLRKQAEGPQWISKAVPEPLLKLIEAFAEQAEKALSSAESGGDVDRSELLLQAYFTAVNFTRIGKLYDERYVTYAEMTREDITIKLFCLDPSYLLQEMGKGYRSRIYFSATLSPLSFYRDMLGAGPDDYTVSIPSPFSREQLSVIIKPLSTRYRDREETREPLVRLLCELARERSGNYLFFFPSYAYMNLIYEGFAAKMRESVQLLLQQGSMTEEEREQYLAAFMPSPQGTLVGFAVMGGIFSEGIDLVGDRLTGVVVVGVGLPQIGLERDIIRDYFNETGRRGFDYAYVFPGMNKVLQAGGRLIRSENDCGVLMLVDDRYLQPQYARLLPEEWT